MDDSTPAANRRRGRPRLVDRDRIVAAAKGFDPAGLTMQALADEMGVDRKTLHYHVDNRDVLLRLVAVDTFRTKVAEHTSRDDARWQDAVRDFATVTREAATAAGAWASYVAYETVEDLEAVRPAELATAKLVDAGLSESDAGDVVRLLAEIAFTSARHAGEAPDDRHTQESILEPLLEQETDGRFPLTRQLIRSRGDARTTQEQFDFDVALVALGVEGLLAQQAG